MDSDDSSDAAQVHAIQRQSISRGDNNTSCSRCDRPRPPRRLEGAGVPDETILLDAIAEYLDAF